MGEVDAVIPESPIITAVNGDVNGLHKITTNARDTNEPMDVDSEDDSQVSSENGVSDISENHNNSLISKLPTISKAESLNNAANVNNKDGKSPSVHSEENSRHNMEAEDDMSHDRQSNHDLETEAENSQGTTSNDENSQDEVNDDPKEDLSSRDNDAANVDTDGDETTNDNSTQHNPLDEENSQSSQNSGNSTSDLKENGVDAIKKESRKSDTEDEDSQSSNCKNSSSEHNAKENGGMNGSKVEKGANDSEDITIIESDEEDEPVKPEPTPQSTSKPPASKPPASGFAITKVQSNAPPINSGLSNNSKGNESGQLKKASMDDDAPVIIPSDSESEDDAVKQKDSSASASASAKQAQAQAQADEDMSGDDCVVIEDDDKKETPEQTGNRQRKSTIRPRLDASDTIEDELPPTKKARTGTPGVAAQSAYLQMGQITIKDPRSLMQQFSDPAALNKTFQQQFAQSVGLVAANAAKAIVSGLTGSAPTPQGIFPNNVRPSLAPLSAPPKLVPTSPNVSISSTLPVSNSNLLPALTDDMFVLEAPSFIVPYIYEKPPSDSLKEIVTKLETELAKIKTEPKSSNKEVKVKEERVDASAAESKPNVGSSTEVKKEDDDKEKKKKKGDTSQDDSWDELDASTDDEASDGEPRTKVLIKDAKPDLDTINAVLSTDPSKTVSAPSTPSTTGDDKKNDPKNENYFESPLGKFFMDIGVNLVQEYVQTDLLKVQKRKLAKSLKSASAETELAIHNLQKNIEASKKRNEPYRFELKRCEYCNFKSESALAMAHHYETPHMRQYLYKCNFCNYETRPAHDILFHMEAVHNIKGRLEKALAYNQCPNCPFEENGKAKFGRHIPVCAKKFRPEVNLQPPHDWEAPAKIPRIKPRHGLVGTATAYQAMAAQAAAQKAQLAAMTARAATAQPTNNTTPRNRGGRPPNAPRLPTNVTAGIRGNAPVRPQMPGVVLPAGYQIASGGQIIQIAGSNLAVLPNPHTLALQQQQAASAQQQSQNSKKSSGQQPSISITPLPRQSGNASTAAGLSAASALPLKTPAAAAGIKPGQAPTGGKASFVICEICDGYIKDLEQLRNHMQWMHKVKIHPKMIHNRPPLNCQKCQFRFFTDQGLERHLLGSHGLVTSSMQEAANKGKDAGRCPVCGRMYQWKLLNHVSRDHHMTLKPAHLSYKCTVCTATFGMYKQFENHVYTAHSTVAKKAMDGKKNNSGSNSNSSMAGGSSSSASISISNIGSKSSHGGGGLSISSANDSLLKPLKINDEITIIPQPASKSRASLANDYESHLID